MIRCTPRVLCELYVLIISYVGHCNESFVIRTPFGALDEVDRLLECVDRILKGCSESAIAMSGIDFRW